MFSCLKDPDDLGGTKTKVTFNGKEQTLHELWDSGILATEEGSARQMAQRLDEEVADDDRKTWEAGTPKEWADESLAITTAYVYPLPEFKEWLPGIMIVPTGGICEAALAKPEGKAMKADRVLSETLAPMLNRPIEQLRERLLVGAPEACAEKLSAYKSAGVQGVFI